MSYWHATIGYNVESEAKLLWDKFANCLFNISGYSLRLEKCNYFYVKILLVNTVIIILTRSVAAGFGRYGMSPPASNDTGTALGEDGSDWSRDLATMTFELLTLKLVRESHQRWETFLPNLGMLGLWVFELFAVYATDGRTDRRTEKSNASLPAGA